MLGGDIQWGRHAEVTFTNFNSGLVTTIKSNQIDENNNIVGDGLRIAFEYSKTDDEGYNSPNGKIIIYGLTEKTFNSVGERLSCEIEVKAGYLKSQANAPKRIFYAVLMDKKYELQGGISVSTFEVLGDFIHKYIAEKMSGTLPHPTLIDIMSSIAAAMNKGAGISLGATDEENQKIVDYLHMWRVPYGYSFAKTPQQELKRLKDSFGIVYRIDGQNMVFSIDDRWYEWHLQGAEQISASLKKKADTALVAENKTAPDKADQKPVKSKGQNINLVKTHALVLSPQTGLIGTPTISNLIVDKAYGDDLAKGEEIWEKKEQRVLVDKKTGQPRKDKDGNVKMSKQPKKMKVARRTTKAKCYINNRLDFNSMVSLITESGICDGLYRVRSLKIAGDTGGTDWFMELTLNE